MRDSRGIIPVTIPLVWYLPGGTFQVHYYRKYCNANPEVYPRDLIEKKNRHQASVQVILGTGRRYRHHYWYTLHHPPCRFVVWATIRLDSSQFISLHSHSYCHTHIYTSITPHSQSHSHSHSHWRIDTIIHSMEQAPVQVGQFILGKNLGIGAFGKVRRPFLHPVFFALDTPSRTSRLRRHRTQRFNNTSLTLNYCSFDFRVLFYSIVPYFATYLSIPT